MNEKIDFQHIIETKCNKFAGEESSLKKTIWIGLLGLMLVSIVSVWLFVSYARQPSENGFKIVFLETNTVLISDVDVLSYNWTNQEMALTDEASERLIGIGDSLYSFTGFVIIIDEDESYRGVFRSAVMSAIPGPPKISILFPSIVFPSENENPNAMRMFYPGFEPPSDQLEENTRLFQYFEAASKLIY